MLHQVRWGGGFVEADSDPGFLITVGYALNDRVVIEAEAGQMDSSFTGFRPPSGSMRSRFFGVSTKVRFARGRTLAGYLKAGGLSLQHDPEIAEDGVGFQAGLGVDYLFSPRYFSRFEARYLNFDDGHREIANPELLFAAGFGVRF